MTQHAANNPSTQAAVRQIQRYIQSARRRWRALLLVEGVGLAIAAVLAYFWIAVLVDSALRLPVIGRLIAGAGLIACLAWLTLRLMRQWRSLKLSEDQVALAVEHNTPGGVQNRLINAIQLSRDDRYRTHALVDALVNDNWRQLSAARLEHARAMKPAAVRAIAAITVIAVGLALWTWRPATFTNAASRILMPFAEIDPLYATTLTVLPGDVETAESQLEVNIRIRGQAIDNVTILRNLDGKRTSVHVPVEPGQREVSHTFTQIDRSFDYAVQGGDFTSRFYHVDVPRATRLQKLVAELHAPAYTGRDVRTVETTGSLEALQGTRAVLTFHLDQPVEKAAMRWTDTAGKQHEQPLSLDGEQVATGELQFTDPVEYQLETTQPNRAPQRGRPHAIRALPDQFPQVELAGLDRHTEVAVADTLAVNITASDDVGLDRVEWVKRRVTPSAPQAADEATPWEPLQAWPADNAASFHRDVSLSMLELQAAEGDRYQLAVRAADRDPAKQNQWSISSVYSLVVGGEGVQLQLTYEQILASENQLAALIDEQRTLISKTKAWLGKFRADSGVRWDDQQNVADLHASAAQMVEHEAKQREAAAGAARDMVREAGVVRFSLGMLADTEYERFVRIAEALQTRTEPHAMTDALRDAQATAERIVSSLEEMFDKYVAFREQWELTHIIPFAGMTAGRQARLTAQSREAINLNEDDRIADLRRRSAEHRQQQVGKLVAMTRTACKGLVRLTHKDQPILSEAFGAAAEALSDKTLQTTINQAAAHAGKGEWSQAAERQQVAAAKLQAVHDALREAQAEAARQAMEALSKLSESDVKMQEEIDELLEGSLEQLLSGDADSVPMEEIIRMQKAADDAKKRHELDDEDALTEDYKWDDSMMGLLYGKKPEKPDFSVLKLAKKPDGQKSFPDSSDLEGNRIELELIEDQFEDLVGDLLEEADDMRDKFETYNLSAQGQGVEEGEIGKQAGDINSVSAAAATGNQKPPTQNYGGASRTGRGGARAHGMVVGNESINRRGRDTAQEGQEKVADQAGSLKEVMSDDPMKDTSTGIGGKKVDSDDTSFSIKDAGKWTDDILGRMDKAQKVHKIVERQDGAFNPELAEQLRDMTSEQEQLIERLKVVQKELKNLYLPTDHLEASIAELTANLDALKESPSPEVFRRQKLAMDRLQSTLRVFRSTRSDFQPSLPREQRLRGRILDNAPRPVDPAYDEAVKQYYEMLSAQ